MSILPDFVRTGYLRVIEPIAAALARRRVKPNHITTFGTLCAVGVGVLYGLGHIRTAGWVLGLTAVFDVLDGAVARRTDQSTIYGAFFDSTLDRIADGAILAGLAYFFATSAQHRSPQMVAVTLLGMIASFLTSYTRARAEALGIDAKVGMLQRPERVVLLSAPQALFGLALDGWVLSGIVVVLTVTAWLTVVQRMRAVYVATKPVRIAGKIGVGLPESGKVAAPAADPVERARLERRVAHP